MHRAEFERLGATIWGGHGWKSEAARAFEVNRKTISRWIADDMVPDWAATRLRAIGHIAPPPGTTADEDRDDACAEAIEGELSRLMELATDAGWQRAEIQVAILSLTVTDMMAHAGTEATMELLDQAKALLQQSDHGR
ncbi:hypothetical protein [Halodurantibacterium flavum]|uniref:Helix-turn-helix domain-containing protein n=1 Tax=Halodurantibacterium flavum TaxID=1382802 RepID=A0ABW4S874_9RHOB